MGTCVVFFYKVTLQTTGMACRIQCCVIFMDLCKLCIILTTLLSVISTSFSCKHTLWSPLKNGKRKPNLSLQTHLTTSANKNIVPGTQLLHMYFVFKINYNRCFKWDLMQEKCKPCQFDLQSFSYTIVVYTAAKLYRKYWRNIYHRSPLSSSI